jgi:hypothetical protein
MPKDDEKLAPLDDLKQARQARLRAQLKAVHDQISITGKPEKMTGLFADRNRIIGQLRELKDDDFLRDYFSKR